MYHYVRDLPCTPFPRIKGMLTADFKRQVAGLCERFEMATLESALAYLDGEYRPPRNLCLLTFDDGLKDHYADVFPILAERRIQGLFFPITCCLEDSRVVAVHKNHFLMAALDFGVYRKAFLDRLAALSPETETQVDAARARRTYRFDVPDVAAFKYLLNFRLPLKLRCRVLDTLFSEYLGDEREFAQCLYISWQEAREMQADGMLVGGHSHRHLPLSTLANGDQRTDLETNMSLLRRRLSRQTHWPFSYPYGKLGDSFSHFTAEAASDVGFCCAFSTQTGTNRPREDRFAVRRIDPKDVVL